MEASVLLCLQPVGGWQGPCFHSTCEGFVLEEPSCYCKREPHEVRGSALPHPAGERGRCAFMDHAPASVAEQHVMELVMSREGLPIQPTSEG